VFGLLEIFAGDGALHPRDDEFDSPLDVRHLRRQRRLAQFDFRAGLIEEIDGLIRQETIRDVPIRKIHRRFDRLVSV
jgi:hypothetical protein